MACWPTPPPPQDSGSDGQRSSGVPPTATTSSGPLVDLQTVLRRTIGDPDDVLPVPGFGSNGSAVGPQHIAFRYTPGRFERPKERSQPSSP